MQQENVLCVTKLARNDLACMCAQGGTATSEAMRSYNGVLRLTVQQADLSLLFISNALVLHDGNQQLLTAGLSLCYHNLFVLTNHLYHDKCPMHLS